MKHNLQNRFEEQQKIVDEIVETTHSEFNTNDRQLHAMIHPILGNSEYDRVNKELENERFKTLINLARVLDDENMTKAINSLNYSILIDKK